MFPRLIVLLLAAMAFAVPARAEKTLRVTLQLSLRNIIGQNLLEFKKIVEAESKGDLKIQIYPSAQLFKDKDVPAAVASGVVEMGVAAVPRFAGTRPAVELFYLPFLFKDNAAIARAVAPGAPIRKILDQEMLSTGARPLWWQAYGMSVMLGRREALTSPEVLKGRKTRVFGKMLGEFIRFAGGAPVLISGSEQFLAYQRGTVDFGMTGVPSAKSRRLYEVMPYLTVTNHAALEFVVLINDRFWREELNDTERRIITAAARRAEASLRKRYARIHRETLDWLDKNTPMKVVYLTPEQRKAWQKAAEPVYALYVRNTGEVGRRLLEEARKLQQ